MFDNKVVYIRKVDTESQPDVAVTEKVQTCQESSADVQFPFCHGDNDDEDDDALEVIVGCGGCVGQCETVCMCVDAAGEETKI